MALLNDTFTDTADLTLASHTSDSGHSWTQHAAASKGAAISNANRLRTADTGSTTSIFYSGWVPTGADYDVQADVTVLTAAGRMGLHARLSTSATTYYLWRWNSTTTSWELYKAVAGTATLLGSYSDPLAVGNTRSIKLSVRGSTITGYVGGVARVTVTDTAVTAAGRAGFQGTVGSNAAGLHLDNFSTAEPVPANTAAPAVTGNAFPGQVLSCSTGSWTNSPSSYAYQWLRAGVAISGATASTYTVVEADGGSLITCQVIATNADGSSQPAVSNSKLAFGTTHASWYMSGGIDNSDPAASLGGGVATSYGGAPSTLFDNVSTDEASSGLIEYRCVYVKNTHPDLSWSPKIFVKTDTSSADDEIAVGLEPGSVSSVAQTIPDEETAPTGVTFSHPTTQAGGLAVGTLAPGDFKAVWIRRTVEAGADQSNPDTSTVRQADTQIGSDYTLSYAIASPPRTIHVFEGPETGMVGTYGFALYLLDGEAAVAVFPPSTDSITEMTAGSGIYIASRPRLTGAGTYLVVWYDGTLEPGNVYLSQYTIDDLLNLTTEITTGQVADAVAPVIRRAVQNAALLG